MVRPLTFDPYVLDPVRRTLKCDGDPVALTAKAFDVLVVLIERRGQVVSKDELLRLVWPDTVVEENNLVRHVSMLRKALNDPVGQHRFIVTVPGRGYSFVGEIEQPPAPDAAPRPPDAAPVGPPAPAAPDVGRERAEVEDAAAPARPAPWLAALRDAPYVPIGLVLAIAVAAFAWVLWPAPNGHATTRPLFQLTFDGGVAHDPVWSPDGAAVAYTSDRDGQADLWIQPVGGGEPRRLTDAREPDTTPDWSPDGRWIVFRSSRDGGGLFLVGAAGGAVRRLTDGGYRPRWSPDGSRILFLSTALDNLREAPTASIVGLDGTPPRVVLGDLLAQMAWPHIAWHPDGRLSVWGDHAVHGWSLWTVDPDGGAPARSAVTSDVQREIDAAGLRLGDFTWAPSGDALYFEGTALGVTNIWRVRVDPGTLHWIAGPDRLTTSADRNREVAISADGSRLAFVSLRASVRLWSWPLAGRPSAPEGDPLTTPPNAGSPELSRGGNRLVYRVQFGNRHELMVRNLLTGVDRRVAGGADSLNDGRFSPDGRTIAYLRVPAPASGRPSGGAVVLQSLERGVEQLLATPGAGVSVSDWSPDGRWILGRCAAPLEERARLCAFPVEAAPHAERAARVVAEHPDFNVWQGRYSPDGRWVVFNAISPADGSVSTLYVTSSEGGDWIRISEGAAFDDKGRWSADGRSLYFVSNRDGHLNVWTRAFDADRGTPGGPATQVTHFERSDRVVAPRIAELDIAVAADRIILPLSDLTADVWLLEGVDR